MRIQQMPIFGANKHFFPKIKQQNKVYVQNKSMNLRFSGFSREYRKSH